MKNIINFLKELRTEKNVKTNTTRQINREKGRHYWKHRDEILEKNRGNPVITYCPFHHFWTHIMNGEINDAIFVTAFMDVSF